MSEDKIEVSKAVAFIPVNERIANQASELLNSQGQSEMAKTIKTLLDFYENASEKKSKVGYTLYTISSLPIMFKFIFCRTIQLKSSCVLP